VSVAALYVDPRGPYPKLLGTEFCWDAERDARTYAGPWPVVAHPPCGPWGKLRHLYRGSEHDCAPRALEQVRMFGGVLEHPAGSRLWSLYSVETANMPFPGELPDRWGGITVEIDQCDFGHVARKKTWVYCVRCRPSLCALPPNGTPTHWISGGRGPTATRNHTPVPPGIKVCSAQQRRRTPVAFAEWLISLARQARREAA